MWRTNRFTEGPPKHQDYPHFVERGTVTEKVSDFPKFTQLIGVTGAQTKGVSCQKQCSDFTVHVASQDSS